MLGTMRMVTDVRHLDVYNDDHFKNRLIGFNEADCTRAKETSNHGKMVTSRTIKRSFPWGLAWRKGGWAGRHLEHAYAYALCSTVVNAQTTLHLLPVTVFIYSLGMLPPPPWCPPPAIRAPEFLQPLP